MKAWQYYGDEPSRPVRRRTLSTMDTPPDQQRRHNRIPKAIPAMITVGQHTVAATTKDVSIGGMFLFTDVLLRQGADLDIVLMLPKEVGLPESRMVCCHGRIVRVEISRGQHGLAAQIESIANLPLA